MSEQIGVLALLDVIYGKRNAFTGHEIATARAVLALFESEAATQAEALAHIKPEWLVLREAAGKLLLGTWPHELMPGVGAAARELDARAANLEAADGAGR